jgi:hypothetical protein
MTYSCIERQFMKIYKAGYSRCINETDVKVNIMRFRTLRSIEFQGLCSSTGIFHGLKTIFLESTFHKLSTNDLLVYQKTVYEDIQSRLFQVHNRKRRTIEKGVKVNIMRFRTLRSIEFQGLCSRNWNFSRSENYIFGIYGP